MRNYPCYLKSRDSGNVYLFEQQGLRCTLYIRGDRSNGSSEVGRVTHVGYNSEDRWWTEYEVTFRYDPSQAGDQDDDI